MECTDRHPVVTRGDLVAALLLCLLFWSVLLAAMPATAAEEVSVRRLPGESAFVIEISPSIVHRWSVLDNPQRLVVDLYGVYRPPGDLELDLADTRVIRVRSGFSRERQRYRLVFDLKSPSEAEVVLFQPGGRGKRQIWIDVAAPGQLKGVPRSAYTLDEDDPELLDPDAVDAEEDDAEPGFLSSLDAEVGGTWEQEWAVETDGGDAQKFEALVEPRIDLNLGGATLTGIARIRLDTVGDLGPDQSSPPNYSDFNGPLTNSEEAEFSLRELYLDFYAGESTWRVGKQQVVWGEADGLKVLDVVNPQSFREFIMDDFDDSRIPTWMVNAEIPIGVDGSLQLLWIPDTTYHELAEPGTPYAFTSPLLVPQPVEGVNFELARTDKPDSISDGDAGARYSLFVGGWDMSFNYLYQHLDAPVFYQDLALTADGPLVTVRPEYERSHLGGMTLSNAFGDFTLRAEVAYNSDTYHLSRNIADRGITESAELASVVGLDWQLGALDVFVSGQWFQSHLMDHDPQTVRSENTHTFSLMVQKNFANATWTFDAIGLYSVDDEDGLVQLKLRHLLFSNTEIWLGADIFSGDDDGVFGQFSDRDRALLGVEIGF